MAKDNREAPRPSKARILFGFAEVEGGDAAVQDNVRSLAAAVVRALQTPQPQARIVKSLPATPGTGNGKREEPNLFNQGEQTLEGVEDDQDDADVLDVEPATTTTTTTPKPPRQPRKAVSYSFAGDLNLKPADKPHLKVFFAEKKPEDQMEQLAVLVFYLARVLNMTGITADHLYTCFNEVDKKVPKDILASCRNTVTRRGWLDPSNPEDIKITVPGENFVKHDLPKSTT